jgi:hypothetical protein
VTSAVSCAREEGSILAEWQASAWLIFPRKGMIAQRQVQGHGRKADAGNARQSTSLSISWRDTISIEQRHSEAPLRWFRARHQRGVGELSKDMDQSLVRLTRSYRPDRSLSNARAEPCLPSNSHELKPMIECVEQLESLWRFRRKPVGQAEAHALSSFQ